MQLSLGVIQLIAVEMYEMKVSTVFYIVFIFLFFYTSCYAVSYAYVNDWINKLLNVCFLMHVLFNYEQFRLDSCRTNYKRKNRDYSIAVLSI